MAALDRGGYQGLAFGAEFCPRRLPPPAHVREALARCRDRGLGFSLVTPVVRQGAFDGVAAWLEGLVSGLGDGEWVANDWGLLAWARERGLPGAPVAGRLLGRQRRDPRLLGLLPSATPGEAEALRGSAWDDPETSALLLGLGVRRVELDLLFQGVRRPSLPPGVALSLCGPWLPVTLTPSCAWSEDPLRCPRACADEAPLGQTTAEDPHPLWSRGNALFARLLDQPAARGVASLGADRLVWAEELPG